MGTLTSISDKKTRYDHAHMRCAQVYADLSFAKRTKVGAVLVNKLNRVVCCGSNGTPSGQPNVCEKEINCVCMSICPDDEKNRKYCPYCHGTGKVLETLPTVVHAEIDCINNAKKMGIRLKDMVLYITHSPCLACADYIDKHGIKTVVYQEEYRITDGIDYLKENNVIVRKL